MRVISLLLAGALGIGNAASNWEEVGRPLPQPEAGTVPLDPRLPAYVRCQLAPSGQAEGSVTTIMPDLFGHWSREFAALHPTARVRAEPPFGPPQGKLSARLRAFLEGSGDFALVSRKLTDADLASYRQTHGADPLVVPVSAGSWRHFGFVDTVVVIVNRANPVRRLSFAQLDAIFSAERRRGHAAAHDWGQLGVGKWEGRPVHVVGAASWLNEDSARSEVVRERVLLGGSWSPALAGSGSEADAPAAVARDRYAIAITGLGHLPPGTRAIALSGEIGEPYVAPDYREIIANRYPLSRTIDMVVKRRPDGTPEPLVTEFLRFILSRKGQAVVAQQGVFLPLRADQVERSLGLIGPCKR